MLAKTSIMSASIAIKKARSQAGHSKLIAHQPGVLAREYEDSGSLASHVFSVHYRCGTAAESHRASPDLLLSSEPQCLQSFSN
jgi:hypothetical protein